MHIDDAIEILKPLVTDNEYKVKKQSLKTLRFFLESGKISQGQASRIKHIIATTRQAGWIT
ncbi:MAG: hypothetical protein ABIH89_01790 [Elusimicrobiota bacterium]